MRLDEQKKKSDSQTMCKGEKCVDSWMELFLTQIKFSYVPGNFIYSLRPSLQSCAVLA